MEHNINIPCVFISFLDVSKCIFIKHSSLTYHAVLSVLRNKKQAILRFFFSISDLCNGSLCEKVSVIFARFVASAQIIRLYIDKKQVIVRFLFRILL